jgi:hypothetical protein
MHLQIGVTVSVERLRRNMWTYILTVVAALYAGLQLRKDWRAHETPWRRGAAFALILIIAIGTAVNNYRSAKRSQAEHTQEEKRSAGLQKSVDAMRGQIDNLLQTGTFNAQRDALAQELTGLHDDLRAGFSKLGVAIKQHPVEQSVAPPHVPHVQIVQRPTPALTDEAPYGLQVIIQPDTQMAASFQIECDGPIAQGRFYIAGQGAMMNVRTGVDGNNYFVSVGYPPISPTNPLVVNLYSKEKITLRRVEQSVQ